MVLGNGCREVCTLELAREILEEAGGLHGLVGVRADALQRRGLGEAKAASILANLEIARRLAETDLPDRVPLSRPTALVRYLYLRYALPDQEVVGALYLNGRHRLIGEEEWFRGTLCRATVEPRQILRSALQRCASGVCLFHYVARHIMELMCPRPLCGRRPGSRAGAGGMGGALAVFGHITSEGVEPGEEDLSFTRRMVEAGEAVGVRLVDHLILAGTGRWVSLKERGAW